MTVLVFLHILGAVIWAGGLIFLGLLALGARRTLPERERTELFHFVGNGFLVLAGVAALLLAVSGNLLVEDLFGGWEQLSGEPSTLIAWKTILFIGVLLLAVLHASSSRQVSAACACDAPRAGSAARRRRCFAAGSASRPRARS